MQLWFCLDHSLNLIRYDGVNHIKVVGLMDYFVPRFHQALASVIWSFVVSGGKRMGAMRKKRLDPSVHSTKNSPQMHHHRNRRIYHLNMKKLTGEVHQNSQHSSLSLSFRHLDWSLYCVHSRTPLDFPNLFADLPVWGCTVVKWYCSKAFFAENNTPHFRRMEVHVCPVLHDFLSLSAGSGVSSPGFRGLSIWVCSTAQGNYWRGQTEGSAGNNDTEQIMTQYNTVAWKWLSYHQGYHVSRNILTAIWKTSTPPSDQRHFFWIHDPH